MTRKEEDCILADIDKAFEQGPSTWHTVTPDYLKKMRERSRAKKAALKQKSYNDSTKG